MFPTSMMVLDLTDLEYRNSSSSTSVTTCATIHSQCGTFFGSFTIQELLFASTQPYSMHRRSLTVDVDLSNSSANKTLIHHCHHRPWASEPQVLLSEQLFVQDTFETAQDATVTVTGAPHSFHGLYILTKKLTRKDDEIWYHAIQRSSGQARIVKIISAIGLLEQKAAMREVQIAHKSQGRNVIQVLEVLQEPDHVYFVMEHLCEETLEDLLAKQDRKRLEEKLAKPICQALLQGLQTVHHQKIALMNSDPSNIFVSRKQGAKWANFGSATIHDNSTDELIHCQSDMRHFGQLMQIMLCGDDGIHHLSCLSPSAKHLIHELKTTKSSRCHCSVEEVLQHPWFRTSINEDHDKTDASSWKRPFHFLPRRVQQVFAKRRITKQRAALSKYLQKSLAVQSHSSSITTTVLTEDCEITL